MSRLPFGGIIKLMQNRNRFSLVTVGGSVTTGSTPLIDLLREYRELKVVDGEFRPGKYVYQLAANIHYGEKTGSAAMEELKRNTVNYGERASLPLAVYYKILMRLPRPALNMVKGHVSDLSRLMMSRRGYEDRVPGYTQAAEHLFDRLADLDQRMDKLSRVQRMAALTECLEQFFDTVSASFIDESTGQIPVFDQMINPNKLFSEPGGLILAKLLPTSAIIVVSRDVRDQYCDMIRKGKKGYHLMDPVERVDRYIHEYSRRYTEMHRHLETLPGNVLHVRFEDLIFHYQDTKKKVENFLDVSDHHTPGKYFDPSIAARNTQLFRNFGYREEISKIEQSMDRWLYPFDSVMEKTEVTGPIRVGQP